MPALDALTAKALAYDDLFTPEWARFADQYTSSLRGEVDGVLGVRDYSETGPELTKRAARMLNLAHTYYVAPPMMALVTAAAEDWPADETVTIEDLPTQQGWLYIPGGITSVDVRGRLLRTSAVSWTVRGGGFDIIAWADKRHDDPVTRTPGWEYLPRYTPWHVGRVNFGEPLPRAVTLGRIMPPEDADKIRMVESEEGYAMFLPDGYSAADLARFMEARPAPEIAWLVSALRIMAQPLATHERVGIPATVRKHLARHHRRLKETAVTIVDFRRPEGFREPGESGRVYSHRWLRRGHWRRQWIGSDALGTRRQVRIWIHVSICGPADKPLLLREHVNALTR
jgi:hypothetical protein